MDVAVRLSYPERESYSWDEAVRSASPAATVELAFVDPERFLRVSEEDGAEPDFLAALVSADVCLTVQELNEGLERMLKPFSPRVAFAYHIEPATARGSLVCLCALGPGDGSEAAAKAALARIYKTESIAGGNSMPPPEYLEELELPSIGQTDQLVENFLALARAAGLEARSVVVEIAVNEARLREVIARCLEAHARALQEAFAREAERLHRRAAEISPVAWEGVLRLLELARAAGFFPDGAEDGRLLLANSTPRRVRLFWREGRLFQYRPPNRCLRVHRITLAVAAPRDGSRFTDWTCRVDCERHPNVGRGGAFCAGELRGRDLLEEGVLQALVTAVEVPNLDSAHWRPEPEELEPADGL
ncbi:MAG: hypothetical protein ACUVTQ_11000 [Desulfotomaculales bacterium]